MPYSRISVFQQPADSNRKEDQMSDLNRGGALQSLRQGDKYKFESHCRGMVCTTDANRYIPRYVFLELKKEKLVIAEIDPDDEFRTQIFRKAEPGEVDRVKAERDAATLETDTAWTNETIENLKKAILEDDREEVVNLMRSCQSAGTIR